MIQRYEIFLNYANIFAIIFIVFFKKKTQKELHPLCTFSATRRRKNRVATEIFPRRDAGKIPSWGLSLAEDEVGQIGVGGVAFEAGRDGVADGGSELHVAAPLVVAAAVGEEDDATALQTVQALGGESTAAAGGQPKVFRTAGGHDEGGLLALHDAHVVVWAACQQVLSEEALVELPVLRQQSVADQLRVRPALIAATVAVGMVLHDVTAVNMAEVVYLPEDDVGLVGGAEQVVVVDLTEPLGRNGKSPRHVVGHPLPEGALR